MRFRAATRPVRTPGCAQFQITECGIAALGSILAHFGIAVPLERVRAAAGASRDGSTAGDLLAAAREFGLEGKAFRVEPDQLPSVGFPSIVHLRFVHFAVLEGIDGERALLNDPGFGRIEVPRERFDEDFTGVVLAFKPMGGSVGERLGARDPGLASVLREGGVFRAMEVREWAALCAALGGASAGVFSLPSIARGVATGPPEMALMGLGVLGSGLLVQAASLSWIRRRVAFRLAERPLTHLLRIPSDVFSYRIPGGLAGLVDSAREVAHLLFGDLVPRLLALASLPVLLLAMGTLHPGIAALASGAVAAYLLALGLLAPWRAHHDRVSRRQGEEEFDFLVDRLDRVEVLKVGGEDEEFLLSLRGGHARTQLHRQAYAASEVALSAAIRFLPFLLVAAVLPLGRGAVAAGRLQEGELGALLLLALATTLPLGALLGARGKVEVLRKQIAHMVDVLGIPPSVPVAPVEPEAGIEASMEGVTFGFGRRKTPIFRDVNLTIRTGEQVGVTGTSGSGKSALAQVLAGLLTPWEGRVLRRHEAEGRERRTAWIRGHPAIFEGTIRDNLTLWEKFPEKEVWEVVEDACLGEVLRERRGGLDAEVKPLGRNFSGGQRQRMEVARALLHGANLLILDEALDGLDPALEAALRANLRRRGCTLVIVSHRAFTLDACDRVLHLVAGRLREMPVSDAPPEEESWVSSHPHQEGGSNAIVPDRVGLAAAFSMVADALGAPPTELASDVEPSTDPRAHLETLAGRRGLSPRWVRFTVSRWWEEDHEPLVAFRRADGGALAVLPDPSGRVRVVDPLSGAEGMWDPGTDTDPGFAREAVQFDRIPLLEGGVWALLGEGLRRGRADAGTWATLGPAIGVITLSLPLAAMSSSSGWAMALPLLFAGGGAALLVAARSIAMARLEARLAWSAKILTPRRLLRVGVPELRSISPAELAHGIVAPAWLLHPLVRGGRERAFDGGVAPAALLLIGWISPPLLLPMLTLVLLSCALPPLLAWAVRGPHLRLEASRRVHFALLSTLVHALPRLRLMGAAGGVARNWLARERSNGVPWGRVHFGHALRDALPGLLPWVGLATLAMLHPGSVSPAIALAAWMALTSSVGTGSQAAALVTAAPLVGAARRLHAIPLEERLPNPGLAEGEIRLSEVDVRLGDRPALSEVSLSVRRGEIVAVTGASGSGKSTLIRALLGFETVCGGEVSAGVQGRGREEEDWRRRVGAVLQGEGIEGAATLRSQVAGLLPAAPGAVWAALREVGLDGAVDAMPMGLQTITDDIRLSTGQRQRLLVARKLLRDPGLIVLDEATSALSDREQAHLLQCFRARGLTCIMVTHRESAIVLADRVVVMERGRIRFDGPPGEVLRRSSVREGLAAEDLRFA